MSVPSLVKNVYFKSQRQDSPTTTKLGCKQILVESPVWRVERGSRGKMSTPFDSGKEVLQPLLASRVRGEFPTGDPSLGGHSLDGTEKKGSRRRMSFEPLMRPRHVLTLAR